MTSGRVAASAMISRIAERGIPAARREVGRTAVAGVEPWLDIEELSEIFDFGYVGCAT